MNRSVKNLLLVLSAVICGVSLLVMVLVLSDGHQTQLDFTPPPFEENAVYGVPDVPETLGWSTIETPVFNASICGRLVSEENSAEVWLYNNPDNTIWLKLRILDESGSILGETGILKPGEYVQSVKLTSTPEIGSTIVLKLMSYTPETYHSEGTASMRTQISA